MTRLDDLGYPIIVAADAREHFATFVRERGYRRVVIACDRNVTALAQRYARMLRGRVPVLSFPLGERRKNLSTVGRVLAAFSAAGADRDTLVVGVGGGVAGDLFGLAAALYMRGVRFANVATSLVAMVDASIGGKTGVDVGGLKNLGGVFCDPVAVFCHADALTTLPVRAVREGLAELVKHGIIEGNDAFESLETLAPHPLARWPWETVIADSLRVKAMIVADDRLEAGSREVLNLGHTFGHAIETVTNFRVSHGAAVSVGLRAAGLLALRTGRFSSEEHLRVLSLLTLLQLPLRAPVPEIESLLDAMLGDKKVRDGQLRFVLPRHLGNVEFGVTVPPRSLRAVLARVREEPGPAELR